jgi:hypothetical protein
MPNRRYVHHPLSNRRYFNKHYQHGRLQNIAFLCGGQPLAQKDMTLFVGHFGEGLNGAVLSSWARARERELSVNCCSGTKAIRHLG